MREEYEMICRKYYKQIYLFLLKLCKKSDLAEELTQETFYQAILSLDRFSGNSDIFTYLAAIAKHTYYKYLRKNKNSLDSISIDDIISTPESTETDPLYLCEKACEELTVRNAVEKLPKKYRDAVLYRIYADMSFKQVADAMGITENSAKMLFSRAKKKLMEVLKNEHDL